MATVPSPRQYQRHHHASLPSWECENQIWEVPEWGPRKAGSDGDDAGPVGCGGAAEPKLLLRKLPIKDEAGEFPINPLPAKGIRKGGGGEKERKKVSIQMESTELSTLPSVVGI